MRAVVVIPPIFVEELLILLFIIALSSASLKSGISVDTVEIDGLEGEKKLCISQ